MEGAWKVMKARRLAFEACQGRLPIQIPKLERREFLESVVGELGEVGEVGSSVWGSGFALEAVCLLVLS